MEVGPKVMDMERSLLSIQPIQTLNFAFLRLGSTLIGDVICKVIVTPVRHALRKNSQLAISGHPALREA
jgi:hypothetical protein